MNTVGSLHCREICPEQPTRQEGRYGSNWSSGTRAPRARPESKGVLVITVVLAMIGCGVATAAENSEESVSVEDLRSRAEAGEAEAASELGLHYLEDRHSPQAWSEHGPG